MRRRWLVALAALASFILLIAAVVSVQNLSHHFKYNYGGDASYLMGRVLFLCMVAVLFLLALGALFFLLFLERIRGRAIERGQFYLLSHFSSTYLFEFDLRGFRLSSIGALPDGLDVEEDGASFTAHQLRALVHPEDWKALPDLCRRPPAPEREVRLELRLRHREGRYVWYECKLIAVYSGRGRPLMLVGQIENIDPRKTREAMLIACSTQDDLTGLLNRRAFVLRVEEWLHSPCAPNGAALLMLDLDDFKSVNDTCGHAGGDQALTLTAQVLREAFRSSDFLCRAGGDEFLIFMTGVRSAQIAEHKADEICRELERRSREGDSVPCTCSVGIALTSPQTAHFPDLFDAADAALYRTKRAGKNSYRLYSGKEP